MSLKLVKQKPYGDLQLLLIPTYQWKDLSIDFVTGLPISTNWKGENYDFILVIVDWLTKMVHYKLVKIIIDALGLAKVILDMVVQYYGLSDSIIINQGSVFTSKFWSSLCYFFGIKQRLSTAFYLQTDGQIKCQNNLIEAYLQAFINFDQDNWVRFLPMAKFTYNNAKNVSTGHTLFKLNCGYYPRVSFKKDTNYRS